MTLDEIRLLFDFGLVVLIWLVQLIIYPGFKYLNSENLLSWHEKYAFRISMVVIPLMMGQLVCALIQLRAGSFSVVINGLLVITLWVLTFSIFVPLHRTITLGQANQLLLNKLVRLNWWRTILWSLVFLLSILDYF